MKKFLLQSALLWVAGTGLLLLASELIVERASMEDILGFSSLSLVYYIVVIFVVYLPFFHLMKRINVDTRHFWWVAPFLLNLPLYILFYILIDRAFRATEAGLFMCLFFFFGAIFGRMYHHFSQRATLQH